MNKLITLFAVVLIHINSTNIFSQDIDPQTIVEEGKTLYRLEMAAWNGTDLFLEKYQDTDRVGGYLSYPEDRHTKCIFFSRADTSTILGTITFDSTFAVQQAKVNLEERSFTDLEKDLYDIRQQALAELNKDTLFKFYKNTSLNLIPLIRNKEKKVYILTGPQVSGVVIFGNDYLITFDENNQVVEKKALHKNIISIPYGQEDAEGNRAVGATHSHSSETGDYITATDICTIMLYSKYAGWKTYEVISDNYLNLWDCEKNTLAIISRKALEKIRKHQENKKKDKKKRKKKKD